MADLADLFFGSIALKNRVLNPTQLAAALKAQGARAEPATLGDVCRQLGYLSEEDVNAILWAQAKSEVLLEETLCGRIAVKNGLLAQQDLDDALAEQARRGPGARLGAILVERGKLTELEVAAVLKTQKRLKESARLRPVIEGPLRPTIEPPARGARATEARPARAASPRPGGRTKKPTTRRRGKR